MPTPDFDLHELDTQPASDAGVSYVVQRADRQGPVVRDGRPVTLTLLGADAERVQAILKQHMRENRDAAIQGMTDEELDAHVQRQALDVLAGATVDWSGFVDTKGQPIPFSRDAAFQLYRRFPDVRAQVEAFMQRRANFLPRSTGTSSNTAGGTSDEASRPAVQP